MDFDEIAQKGRELAYQGLDYSEIIQQLPYDSLSQSEQKELRSLLDDFIVQYNLADQVKLKYKTQMMLGAVGLFIGLFILLFTYLRQESNYGIGLAASLIGLYVIKKGYDQYRQPIEFLNVAPKKESKFHRY